MMHGLLFAAVIYGGVACASTGTSVFLTSTIDCSTGYGSGGAAPTPVRTSYFSETYRSTVTAVPTTVAAEYTTITAPAVTTTERTSTTYTISIPTLYSGILTRWISDSATVATATVPLIRCANGVKPKTVTQYTGKYTPLPGQSTALPETYGTQIYCTTSVIFTTRLFPTVSSGLGTIHTTPTVVIPRYTTTTTVPFIYTTVTSPTATVTTYQHNTYATQVGVPTTKICEPTVTTTLDARCAPTNLVANYGEYAVGPSDRNKNDSYVAIQDAPYTGDRSLCCQLCLDNEGCRASQSDRIFCGLWYQSDANDKPQCDQPFALSVNRDYLPGSAYILAAGCGPIMFDT